MFITKNLKASFRGLVKWSFARVTRGCFDSLVAVPFRKLIFASQLCNKAFVQGIYKLSLQVYNTLSFVVRMNGRHNIGPAKSIFIIYCTCYHPLNNKIYDLDNFPPYSFTHPYISQFNCLFICSFIHYLFTQLLYASFIHLCIHSFIEFINIIFYIHAFICSHPSNTYQTKLNLFSKCTLLYIMSYFIRNPRIEDHEVELVLQRTKSQNNFSLWTYLGSYNCLKSRVGKLIPFICSMNSVQSM